MLINMAMTADGKIATANRRISRFGSRRDAAHLYRLRATVDAVLCGARTVMAEKATLDFGGARHRRERLRLGLAETGLRIVATRSGAFDLDSPLVQVRTSPILFLTTERAGPAQLERLAEVASQVLVCGRREIDFRAAFAFLRERWGVERLLCEGGGELNAALFRRRLVHEVHLTIAPYVVGGREAPTIAGGRGVARLTDATRLELVRARRVARELFCVYRVVPGAAAREPA